MGHMAITYGPAIGDCYYREQGGVSTVFAVLVMLLLAQAPYLPAAKALSQLHSVP